jgi:hypothetical protein
LLLIVLVSCKSNKIKTPVIIEKTIIDTTIIEEKLFEKQLVSQAIYDSMFLVINELKTENELFNKECDKEIDRILSQINFTKKSGDNKYSIVYNQLKKQIEITAEMQELINKQDSAYFNKQEIKTEIKEVPVQVPVYTNVLTKLQKWLIGFGIAFLVFIGFKIFRIIKLNII